MARLVPKAQEGLKTGNPTEFTLGDSGWKHFKNAEWFDTDPPSTWEQVAGGIGKFAPLGVAAGNVIWNLHQLKRIRDAKLAHREKPYDEAYMPIQPAQRYPSEIKRSYLQDIASANQPQYKGSDAQVQQADLGRAGAQANRAITEMGIREAGYVADEKRRFGQEMQQDMLQRIATRMKNTDLSNALQAYRDRAQIDYLQKRAQVGTQAFNAGTQALYAENLYNAKAANIQDQNTLNILWDELHGLEAQLNNTLPEDVSMRQRLQTRINAKRQEIYQFNSRKPRSTMDIRSRLLLGVEPNPYLVSRG